MTALSPILSAFEWQDLRRDLLQCALSLPFDKPFDTLRRGLRVLGGKVLNDFSIIRFCVRRAKKRKT
jgi:hypothetical protein